MKYDMFVLPFRGLPFANYPYEDERVRQELIKEWCEGDLFKYSFGFLFSAHEPKVYEDYKVPIADVIDGKLVTTKEIIFSIANSIKRLNFTYDVAELREHITPYYRVLGLLPHWGEPEYYKTLREHKTPRVLHGPHKAGNLRPNQKRMVLLNEDNNLVFGPLILS